MCLHSPARQYASVCAVPYPCIPLMIVLPKYLQPLIQLKVSWKHTHEWYTGEVTVQTEAFRRAGKCKDIDLFAGVQGRYKLRKRKPRSHIRRRRQ